jgi:hypothetical protein
VPQVDVPAVAPPVRVRARVHGRVVLLRPGLLRVRRLHLLVLLLQLGQALLPELQSRVRSVHRKHLLLLRLVFVLFGGAALRRHRQDGRVLPVADLVRYVEALVLARQLRQLLERLGPGHAALHVHGVQLGGGGAGRVLPQERDGADALHHLAPGAQVEDPEVEPPGPLRLSYYGLQGVREIPEYHVKIASRSVCGPHLPTNQTNKNIRYSPEQSIL